jgi:hypothetical protein
VNFGLYIFDEEKDTDVLSDEQKKELLLAYQKLKEGFKNDQYPPQILLGFRAALAVLGYELEDDEILITDPNHK